MVADILLTLDVPEPEVREWMEEEAERFAIGDRSRVEEKIDVEEIIEEAA